MHATTPGRAWLRPRGALVSQRSRSLVIQTRCEASEQQQQQQQQQQQPNSLPPALPKRGYFSIADPKAQVYVRNLGTEKFDPTKKGGRWEKEFIWQTKWQDALEREEMQRRREAEQQAQGQDGAGDEDAAAREAGKGFVSLAGLPDDIDVGQLIAAKRRQQQQQQQQQDGPAASAAPSSSSPSSSSSSAGAPAYNSVPPTRKESKKFDRARKAEGRAAAVVTSQAQRDAERAAMAEQERANYQQLKLEFQAWTLSFIALGGGATYAAYSPEVCASYLVGAAGGLAYLRLLSRSVDGVGASGLAGLNAAAGQPRLLIPVVLALAYNRWNTLYADDANFHLQLLPELVGFFTYKLAVVARQSLTLMQELTASNSSSSSSSSSSSAASE